MRKIFVLIALCLRGLLSAQDANFSQFYEQPLLRNPALAGVFDCNFRVKSVYRNQWQSVTVPYRTSGLSMEMKFPGNNGNWHNAGLQVMYDVAGDSRLSRTMVLPGYSYHLQLQEYNYLSFGFLAGPVTSNFDVSKLTWDDQFVNGQYSSSNPTQQILTNTRRTYLETALGMVFSRPLGELGNLYAGASLFHVNRPVVSFDAANKDRLSRKLGVNMGLTVPSGARNSFTMYGDGFWQGGHRQTMFGAIYSMGLSDSYYDDINRSTFALGGVYRWDDAFIPVLKLEVGNFGIGLSYDVNVSKLRTASQSRGGFELTLSYRNCSVGADRNGLPCPTFGKNF